MRAAECPVIVVSQAISARVQSYSAENWRILIPVKIYRGWKSVRILLPAEVKNNGVGFEPLGYQIFQICVMLFKELMEQVRSGGFILPVFSQITKLYVDR